MRWRLRTLAHILGLHYKPDHIQVKCWCQENQSKEDEINEKLWKEWQ